MAALCDSCGWSGTAMRVRDGGRCPECSEPIRYDSDRAKRSAAKTRRGLKDVAHGYEHDIIAPLQEEQDVLELSLRGDAVVGEVFIDGLADRLEVVEGQRSVLNVERNDRAFNPFGTVDLGRTVGADFPHEFVPEPHLIFVGCGVHQESCLLRFVPLKFYRHWSPLP